MAGKQQGPHPRPMSDLVSGIIDPVLARRAGMTTGLIQSWCEIVGERLGACTRPERIRWERRGATDEPFEPATLVIACDGPNALLVQHQTAEIIARVNGFLGFAAIGRVRIVQKPLVADDRRATSSVRALSPDERRNIASRVAEVDDLGLREALERLGASVVASRRR